MRSNTLLVLPLVVLIAACGGAPREPASVPSKGIPSASSGTQVPIAFERGNAGFADGDEIVVTSVSSERPTIASGGRYHVEGTWRLRSRKTAALALYATNGEVTGANSMTVSEGEGRFVLDATLAKAGFLHVSFYPVPPGESFGGTYFGVGEGVYRGSYVPGPRGP